MTLVDGDSLVLEVVRERDVDLLLVEEILCSPAFARFLFEQVWVPGGPIRWGPETAATVRHSVSHFDEGITPGVRDELVTRRGETDIEVRFTVAVGPSDLRLGLLVENKIDANFTDLQPQRYASRAKRLIKENRFDQVRTLLVAPADYLRAGKAAAFDSHLSYETIRDYFASRYGDGDDDEPTLRYRYRRDLMDHGIHQFRRTGVTVAHGGVSEFRRAYYERALALYPDIGMRPPKDNGQWAGDAWMEFYDAFGAAPPVKGNIKHKCPQGRVDLQLSGWARGLSVVGPEIQKLLDPDMVLRQANKSLAVSIAVPAVGPQAGAGAVDEVAEKGIHAAARLQRWYRRHAPALVTIGRTAGLL